LKTDDTGVRALEPDPQLSQPRSAIEPVNATRAAAVPVVEGEDVANAVTGNVGDLDPEPLVGRGKALQ
jgi:hypothetical protein